jgi:methylamine---glutamate N-methyltransferase subunit C
MLLGLKISERVAKMRTLPQGIDQRSACRHPDWVGPDDLTIKIAELREIADWQLPIYVKFGATHVRDDVKLAVKAGADVIVIDGMRGGTATQQVFIEHAGIPTLPALRLAVEAFDEMNVRGQVQLIISGGIRSGADVAKALAMGADAVSIGQSVLMALGCNSEIYTKDGQQIDVSGGYERLGGNGGRFLPPLPNRSLPRGSHHSDPGSGRASRPGMGCRRLKITLTP